ncbi:MAG: hypothetical protein ABIO79_05025 [Ferruginibacter sp.]
MKFKYLFLLVFSSNLFLAANAQKSKADSLELAKTLHNLLRICRSIDFGDPKVVELGYFYKAAPYIVYQGDDKARSWKVFADYTKADEKKGVDEVCERLNQTANQDSAGYRIIEYFTEKESEGTWHVLLVRYKRKAVEKTTAYAFLKIGNKFGLGDID